MTSVGAYEAKTRRSALLDEVERGDTVTITKHGRTVARLVPVGSSFSTPISDLLVDFDHHRTPRSEGDETIREMIDAGRRWHRRTWPALPDCRSRSRLARPPRSGRWTSQCAMG